VTVIVNVGPYTIEARVLSALDTVEGTSLPLLAAHLGAGYDPIRAALQRLRRKGLATVGYGSLGYSWHRAECPVKHCPRGAGHLGAHRV
jgi:hypothetical protein